MNQDFARLNMTSNNVHFIDPASIPPTLREAPTLPHSIQENNEAIAAYNAHTARLAVVGAAPSTAPQPDRRPSRLLDAIYGAMAIILTADFVLWAVSHFQFAAKATSGF